jgi:hypothetical protein
LDEARRENEGAGEVGVIKVHTMEDGFVGEHVFRSVLYDNCPGCGGIKSDHAKVCISCRTPQQDGRSEQMMARHRRVNAALEAGWELGELIAMFPFVPGWTEIARRDIGVVIRAWWGRG